MMDLREFAEAQSKELSEKLQRVKIERNEFREELESYKRCLENSEVKVARLQDKIETYEKEKERLKKANQGLPEKIEDLHSKVEKLLTEKCDLKTDMIHLRENLLKEKENNLSTSSEIQRLKNENSVLKEKVKVCELNAVLYNGLVENIAHFAEEAIAKQKDLPSLGQNNMENIEMRKLVNFIHFNTEKLKNLVPDGLNDKFNGDCKICHRPQHQFLKCSDGKCGSIFHKECIQNWYKTKRECPCCHKDSVKSGESSEDN